MPASAPPRPTPGAIRPSCPAAGTTPDDVLVRLAARGDARAFALLFPIDQWRGTIRRYRELASGGRCALVRASDPVAGDAATGGVGASPHGAAAPAPGAGASIGEPPGPVAAAGSAPGPGTGPGATPEAPAGNDVVPATVVFPGDGGGADEG